jgi:hypothetical protein
MTKDMEANSQSGEVQCIVEERTGKSASKAVSEETVPFGNQADQSDQD